MITPRCLAPPFPARCLKIMRRWRRQDQRDVKIVYQLPRFYSRTQVHFNFSTTLLFALSRFEFTADFYFCQLDLSLVASCFCFFKWGEAFGLPQCSAQPAHIFIRRAFIDGFIFAGRTPNFYF